MIAQTFKIYSCALLAATSLSHADQTLYMQSCGACHGADGKGVGGQFPALAESEWVQGDAERMIQLVLHGIAGPITVKGKTYNLAMPPQGQAFTDEKLAELLTYVRSSFGNEESAVTKDLVATERAKTKDRSKPWTSDEITKLYPLPKKPSMLKNLVARAYYGEWKKMPDLKKLEPNAVEEEHDGLMDVNKLERKDNFAMQFTGDLEIKKAGAYEFLLDSDDASSLWINGRRLAIIRGRGPMNGSRLKKGSVTLKPGTHYFRVDYWEATGQQALSVQVKGPGVDPNTFLTVAKSQSKTRTWPSIPIETEDGRAVLYRNFISGTSARAIGVGYPEGVNLAYSADHFNVDMAWTGKFMDGGRHWTNRGQGAEPPAGKRLSLLSSGPAFALLENVKEKWPKKFQSHIQARFRGYKLTGDSEIPEFRYEVAGTQVIDSIIPSDSSLSRTLTLASAPKADKPLRMRVISGVKLSEDAPGQYFLEDGMSVTISGSAKQTVVNGNSLILTLSNAGAVQITYSWN